MSATHYFFDIFAFTVALLELIYLYREGKIAGRRWIVPTLIGLLIAFGGVVVYGSVQHRTALLNAQGRITDILKTDAWTFDELSHRLPYSDLPMVSEALDDLIRAGSVMHDEVRLSQPDGSIQHEVRLYRAKKP